MTPMPEPEAPMDQGSRLSGILGAFLGALLGETLWFLLLFQVDLDGPLGNSFLLLGFAGGLFSCWGYRLFRGLRSMPFAKNTVLITTLLACPAGIPCGLTAGILSACRSMGQPVTGKVFRRVLSAVAESLTGRGILVMLLVTALLAWVGTGLGMNGLLKYADPAWYADPRRIACSNRGGALYNDPSLWRMAVSGPAPEAFTVGKVLSVSGDTVTVQEFLRGEYSFSAGEIAGVILGPNDGRNVLFDRENRALAKFAWSMKGSGFLMQYLLERRVPLFDHAGEPAVLETKEPEYGSLPQQFTVREGKVCLVLGWIGTVGFGLLALFCFLVAPPEALIAGVFFLALALLSAWMLSSYHRRRLEVDGNELSYTTSFGRTTRFSLSQVERTTVNPLLGTVQLRSYEGTVLARFESNMENSDLLQIYLDRHLRQTDRERNG